MSIKFDSTLLAQEASPLEIQKADLDLLKKINEVSKAIESSSNGLSDSIKTFISNEITKTPGRITSSYTESDRTTRTFSTSWADGMVTANYEFKGNSKLLVLVHVPMRNDSASWGGGYTELQYSLNGNAFTTLGHSGYDGPMDLSSNTITSVNYQFLLDISTAESYKCQFKLRHRSYDGTLTVNGDHEVSSDEFFTKIIIIEISKGETTVDSTTPAAQVRNYFYRYNNSNSVATQYIHFKTSQTMNNVMNTVKFEGYEYGSSKPVSASVSYYPYSPSNAVINVGTYGSHTCGAYKSSDGYAVITILVASTYFLGLVLSQMGPGPQGLFPITITAVTNSSSATGVY